MSLKLPPQTLFLCCSSFTCLHFYMCFLRGSWLSELCPWADGHSDSRTLSGRTYPVSAENTACLQRLLLLSAVTASFVCNLLNGGSWRTRLPPAPPRLSPPREASWHILNNTSSLMLEMDDWMKRNKNRSLHCAWLDNPAISYSRCPDTCAHNLQIEKSLCTETQ